MSVNMGLVAFASAFLIGTLAAKMTADDIFGVFPGGIFVVLVGITYLFAIAQRNGARPRQRQGSTRTLSTGSC
jgi:hypothetical protein